MSNTPAPRAGRGRGRRDSATPPRPSPENASQGTMEKAQGRGRGKDRKKNNDGFLADVGGAPPGGRGGEGRGEKARDEAKSTQDGGPSRCSLNRGRRSPSDAAAGSTAARADEVPTRKTPVAPKTSEDLEGHDAEETPAAHGHPQGHSTARTAPYSRSGRISATLPSAAELLRPVPRKSLRRALRGACTNFDFAK